MGLEGQEERRSVEGVLDKAESEVELYISRESNGSTNFTTRLFIIESEQIRQLCLYIDFQKKLPGAVGSISA